MLLERIHIFKIKKTHKNRMKLNHSLLLIFSKNSSFALIESTYKASISDYI